MTLVEGMQVEYFSPSNGAWLPAVVAGVDEETGAARIDLKPHAPLDLAEQRTCLRPRTQPTQAQLAWVRAVLREGRLEKEGHAIFLRHAKLRYATGMRGASSLLQDEELDAAGAELDRTLGVSGCVCALRERARTSGDARLLTPEGFMESFWELLWGVQREFCQAIARRPSQRLEDPGEVYDFEKILGSGTYGEVKLARDKATGARRAIKRVGRQFCGDAWLDELEHLVVLDHPNIVKLYEHYEDSDHVYLVMDYCCGGELQSAVAKSRAARQSLPEEFVSDVMQQVLLAMAHVHCRGIVHSDVKSANIMLMPSLESTMLPGRAPASGAFALRQVYEKPHVMVIDLGVAKIFRPGNFRHNRPIGTPATMAPEVWSGDITPKADVFSCGVVFFELLSLSLPFNCTAQHEEAINYWFSMPLAPWSRTRHASNAAVELCRRMLRLDRHQRPTASQCLRTPFFETRGASDDVGGSVAALLGGLVHVPERSVLHNSVALSIAQAWPSNQLPTIKAAFRELDTGASGQLTKDQIAGALERLGVDREPAHASADAMDLSRSGTVGWTEFVAGCIRLGNDKFEEDLQRIFKEADRDNDGLLTQKDIANLLAGHPLQRSDAARDVFADLVGRVDPGARVDWPTFRRHFRCPLDDSEDSLAAPALMTAPIMVPSCHQAGAEIMEHAMDLWERAVDLGHAIWPIQEDPGEPEEEQLQRLAEMGFTDRDRCISVLKRHRNKLCSRAVEELTRGSPSTAPARPATAGRRVAGGRASSERRPSTAPREMRRAPSVMRLA